MVPENRNALVDLLAEAADLTRAFGELVLPPTTGHRLEQCDQGHWSGNQNPAPDRVFDEARIGLGGGAEEGLAGNNSTVNAGADANCFSYDFAASLATCLRTWPA